MSDEVLKQLATSVLSLLVGYLLVLAQQGGRRRLRRRDLREDLELLHLLEQDGRHAETAQRLQVRLSRDVSSYEPAPAEQVRAHARALDLAWNVVLLGAMLGLLAFLVFVVDIPPWLVPIVAATLGVTFGVIDVRWRRLAVEG